MIGFLNDTLRFFIARVIILLGVVLDLRQRIRIRRFTTNQRRLRQKYRLHDDTPVVSYGAEVLDSINHAAAHARSGARFALTSGSTGEPKKILYTRTRLRTLKLTFSEMFARAVRAYGLKRTSLYVFSSLSHDTSLTSMLLNEPKLPSYLSTLQAPYRVQQHPVMRALADEYGAAAVRLWILTIANPGVLYATNPSTISTFFDELQTHWTACSRLIRDWHTQPDKFDRTARKIAQRLNSSNSSERLRLVTTSNKPLPLEHFAPAVRAYVCWTGGYVKPFLDRLANHLPPTRYRLIPMYSMSTETVETETVFRNGDAYFLPLAAGVVYEFDEVDLLTPNQVKIGETYEMVVSDAYGLRRY
ncbi:MAG TPA: GH3 auxin-responsive promoter family protein, partial [Pyrinomonadaceae bacterium]|nr:GH3 auxin-responsive promoter family protein [Pyrinomonadaceae bacterium]